MFIVLLLDNKILNELPQRQALGKQSVAKLRNNRTAVLWNPFLGNGSINTLPRIRNNIGRCVFSEIRAEGLSWRQLWRPGKLVVGSFQVNPRRSEQINSGTSGGSKRSGTRSTEEYKRSACEDVKCHWMISCVISVVIWVTVSVWRSVARKRRVEDRILMRAQQWTGMCVNQRWCYIACLFERN
jgi:hypothetical protein